MADSGRLSAKQDKAIDVLLSTGSLQQAARKAEVSQRTLRRWRREDEAFREEYDRRRREALENGVGLMHQASALAAATLLEEMRRAESEAVRVRAATSVLRLGLLGHNQLDVELRLRELEEALKEALRDE